MNPLFALIATPIIEILGKLIPDPNKKAEVQLELAKLDWDSLQKQANALQTELSGNWMQRSWRPLLMFIFMGMMVNNYVLLPYMQVLGIAVQPLNFTPEMWDLLKIGVGGYIVARSGEKVTSTIAEIIKTIKGVK